jgi:hypothetical protein
LHERQDLNNLGLATFNNSIRLWLIGLSLVAWYLALGQLRTREILIAYVRVPESGVIGGW